MGWRDDYKVHPAADVFPMMSDEELAELGEDIKANGLKVPMGYAVIDGERFILDGRNRLEAMERAGIKIPFGMLQPFTCCADHDTAASTIISINIKRRHLTKQQQADMIVAALKAAENAKADGAKLDHVEPVSVGGRGNKNSVRQAAVEEGKKHGISENTTKRSLAKAEGKKRSERHRRTDAELERDNFLRHMSNVSAQDDADVPRLSDTALDLLTTEQRADAIETIEKTTTTLDALLDRLKERQAA